MTTAKPDNGLLPHLFRTEYAKMTAVLCRHFGLEYIELAEDIVSETFLKAAETWPVHGVPQQPSAWLYAVARNKAKDHFRRSVLFQQKVQPALQQEDQAAPEYPEFTDQQISDSQLAMIFMVCRPGNSREAQICLALQVLCGFSVEEIANAFLAGTETIRKRLVRARSKLREEQFRIQALTDAEITERLDTVLKTLYLLFNEGYFSKTDNSMIREELCSEAIRLGIVLTGHPLTNTPATNALLALMCFQSSRLAARTNEQGETVLFEEQDRTLWDEQLIRHGNHYLITACSGKGFSRYHLEASIAYWHTTPGEDKWPHILLLYDQLVLTDKSPVTALNRIFALGKVHGPAPAITAVLQLPFSTHPYYHSLLGYLYSGIQPKQAIHHYEQAIALTRSKQEQQTLQREIRRLRERG